MSKEAFIEEPQKERIHDEERREIFERLLPLLKQEAENLREQGFPVDDDCRINLREFTSLYTKKEIEADIEETERIQSGFKEPVGGKLGDLLEAVKTLAFNQLWFHGKLVAVRTARYDDLKNGIDEVVFDLETKESLAVIDTTTNPIVKVRDSKFQEKVNRGDVVKYGVSLTDEGVEKTSYTALPIFIVSLKPEDVDSLAGEMIRGKGGSHRHLGETIMQHFLKQSELFSHKESVLLEVRRKYSLDHKIFEGLAH